MVVTFFSCLFFLGGAEICIFLILTFGFVAGFGIDGDQLMTQVEW